MQLWSKDAGGRWVRTPLGRGVQIGVGSDGQVAIGGGAATSAVATVIPLKERAKTRAVLVCSAVRGAWVTVNGYPPLGVTMLEDRDEIVIPGGAGGERARFVFTELEPVRVQPFAADSAGANDASRCGRCWLALRSGDAAVRCSVCGRWYHEGPRASGGERRCWTYDPACGACHTTRAAMSWSPAFGEEGEEGEEEEPQQERRRERLEDGRGALVAAGNDAGSGGARGAASTEVAA